MSYYALDNNNTQICRYCVGLGWDQSYRQMIAQRHKDQKDGVGRHIWNETEQQLVFDLIASAPGHLWASQTAASSRSTSSLLFLPFCCHRVENLSYRYLQYRFQGVVWSTSKVTCVHAWNLFSFAEHLKWSLICSQPENPGLQLNVDLMAALLNLKSSATLNEQICHIEVIAARYRKPRVPRCQIVKGSTVEQRFMGH